LGSFRRVARKGTMNNISFRRHPYHLCRFALVVGILNALPIPGKKPVSCVRRDLQGYPLSLPTGIASLIPNSR
jgi:hypothetical protein